MKKLKDYHEFERPREKLVEKGAEALSDTELMAILIGSGTQKADVLTTSRKIVKRFDNEIVPTLATLQEIEGVGIAKACIISAAIEFSRRKLEKKSVIIREASDILPLVSHIISKKQEYFLCITLTGANEVIACRTITIGLLNASQVHPREVFADAITDRAASVIFVHNHPSGQLSPSRDDCAVTKRLCEAGKIIGINCLDHVIVTETGHYSFCDNGIMPV